MTLNMQKNEGLNFPSPIRRRSPLLSYLTTHCEKIINFSSDEGSQEAQMFLELSSAYRVLKTFIPVGSKHYLLILWQELPHATIHLSERQIEADVDDAG